MKINIGKKILIITIVSICFTMLFSIKVFAEETEFKLSEESLDVKLNATRYLSYSGGSGTVTWGSSDESVATVDKGAITGLKIGTTTITATRGEETATCTVDVVYNSLTIGENESKNVGTVNLIIKEHDTETLTVKVEDGKYKEVDNPANITWTSSDSSVVTVDSNGKLTAVKAGTSTITATAAGVEDTVTINVYNGPEYTDFSNAKYENDLEWNIETLKITGIIPNKGANSTYYYIITANDEKPNLIASVYGTIDHDAMKDTMMKI